MSEPYYDRDGITLYLGDCGEVLPLLDLQGGVVISDPPYGSGRHVDKRKRGERTPIKGAHVHDAWDRFSLDWLPLVGSAPLAVFTSHANLGALMCAVGPRAKVAYWRKTNPMPIAPPSEPCVIRGLSVPAGSEWRGYNGPTEHPTGKPLGLMAWIIGHTSRDALILDPFAGSGTTLQAARDRGQRAVGIEISEQFCEMAVRRLAQRALALEAAP